MLRGQIHSISAPSARSIVSALSMTILALTSAHSAHSAPARKLKAAPVEIIGISDGEQVAGDLDVDKAKKLVDRMNKAFEGKVRFRFLRLSIHVDRQLYEFAGEADGKRLSELVSSRGKFPGNDRIKFVVVGDLPDFAGYARIDQPLNASGSNPLVLIEGDEFDDTVEHEIGHSVGMAHTTDFGEKRRQTYNRCAQDIKYVTYHQGNGTDGAESNIMSYDDKESFFTTGYAAKFRRIMACYNVASNLVAPPNTAGLPDLDEDALKPWFKD